MKKVRLVKVTSCTVIATEEDAYLLFDYTDEHGHSGQSRAGLELADNVMPGKVIALREDGQIDDAAGD